MILTKCERLEKLPDNLDLIKVEFDEGKETAYCIWSYDDLIQYLNNEAIVKFRKDMYRGEVHKFVETIAHVSKITTLDRTQDIRLYANVKDSHCNVEFVDISEGSTFYGAILYVSDVSFSSSARASWADLTVMDQARRVATLRIFSPDNKTAEIKGRYIQCDVHHNKFGFSTETAATIDSSFPYSPEVEIAERYIPAAFADDPEVGTLISDSKFIDFAKLHVDIEPGFVLSRLAMELDLANELANIQRDANVDIIKRCLLLDKFFVFQTQSPFKRDIVTFVTVSRYTFKNKTEALLTLFSDDPRFNKERLLISQIKEMVDQVIRIKKGQV